MSAVLAPRTSVLFVDDEARVLEGIRRLLRSLRDEWDMEFVDGSQVAIDRLSQRPFDVVVADMRMPGMDGAELLAHVKAQHPQSVRLILSGHADTQSTTRAIGIAHQYLSKPCDAGILKNTISRAAALKALLNNPGLTQLIGRLENLPSMPSTYRDLLACLRAPDASLADAGVIVARDPAMTVKLLQLVNSAYFGLGRPITSVERAVAFVGLETLMSLVLGNGIFTECKALPAQWVNLDLLWSRSLRVACSARFIAQHEDLDKKSQDDAFLAGMLQDLGTLLFTSELPEQYCRACDRVSLDGVPRCVAETEEFGATHAEVGAYLIGLWGLPNVIVEAIAFHALPSAAPTTGMCLAGVVHLAERLVDGTHASGAPQGAVDLDDNWLQSLGRPDAWQELLGAWQVADASGDQP